MHSGNRVLTALEADVALSVCEQIALGETLTAVCAKENAGKFPAHITFVRWMLMHPWVKQAYDAALELRAYALEDEALIAARGALNAKKDAVPGIRTMLEQLRWSAEKGNTKQYGNKGVATTIVPIHITTSMNLGQPGAEDAVSPDNVWKVEAKVPDLIEHGPVEAAMPERIGSTGPRKRVLTPKVLEDGTANQDWIDQRKANLSAAQQTRRAKERGELDE